MPNATAMLTQLGDSLLALSAALGAARTRLVHDERSLARSRHTLDAITCRISRIAAASTFAGLGRAAAPAIAIATLAALARPTNAEPLNPCEFESLGTLDTTAAPTVYIIDTDALTFTGPAIPNADHTYHGVLRGSQAVFCFDELTVASGTTLAIAGHRSVALLSKLNAFFGGSLYATGGTQLPEGLQLLGPGAGPGGLGASGPIAAGPGGGPGGGAGGTPDGLRPSGGSFGGGVTIANQSQGGPAYGDLMVRLEGGSGGGGNWTSTGSPSALDQGGAGGGAVELGAVWGMVIGATILASGGDSSRGGGGSGGAILVHAYEVDFYGCSLQASGGASNNGAPGAGGRVVIQSHYARNLHPPAVVSPGGPGAQAGQIRLVDPNLVFDESVNFGTVPPGTTKTLYVTVQNSGDPGSCINGQFPVPGNPAFARVGDGMITGLKPGMTMSCAYTFSPTEERDYFGYNLDWSGVTEGGWLGLYLRGRGGTACESTDFNGDGDFGTDADIEAFFRVLAGGHC